MTTSAQHTPAINQNGLSEKPSSDKQMQDENVTSQKTSSSQQEVDNPSLPPVVSNKPKRKRSKSVPPPAPQRTSSISATIRDKVIHALTKREPNDVIVESNLDKLDQKRTSRGVKRAQSSGRDQIDPKKGNVVSSSHTQNHPNSINNQVSQNSILKPRDRIKSILVGNSNDDEEHSLEDNYGSGYNASLMKISHGDVQRHTVAVTTPIVPSASSQVSHIQAQLDPKILERDPAPFHEEDNNLITPQQRTRSQTSPFHLKKEESTDIALPPTEELLSNHLSLSDPIARAYRQHLTTRMEHIRQLMPFEGHIPEYAGPVSSNMFNMSPQLPAMYPPNDLNYPNNPPPTNSNLTTPVSVSTELSSNNNINNGEKQNILPMQPQNEMKEKITTTPPSSWDNFPNTSQQQQQTNSQNPQNTSILDSVKHLEQVHSIQRQDNLAKSPSKKSYRTLPRSFHHQQREGESTDQAMDKGTGMKKKTKSVENLTTSNGESGMSSIPEQDPSSASPSLPHTDVEYATGAPQHEGGIGEWDKNQFYKQPTSRSSSCSSTSSSIHSSTNIEPVTSCTTSPNLQHFQPLHHVATLHHLPHRSTDLDLLYQSTRSKTSQSSPTAIKMAPIPVKPIIKQKHVVSEHDYGNQGKSLSILPSLPYKFSGSPATEKQVIAQGQGAGLHSAPNSENDGNQLSTEYDVKDNAGKCNKQDAKKLSPYEFKLCDYIAYHSSHFPKRVQITKGYSSNCSEITLSQGELFDLHFVHQSKSVIMTDFNQVQYTVPMSSLATFSIVYDPFKVEKMALLGFHFKTAGAVMDLKDPPAVMASTLSVNGGSAENSLDVGEVVILQGVKNSFHGRLLKVFSVKMNLTKFLDEQCAANFTTDPAMIHLTLPQIYDFSIPLPQKAFLCPSSKMVSSIHKSLKNNTVTLKKFTTIKYVAATAQKPNGKLSSSEYPVLDIDVSLNVNVQEVATVKAEHKIIQQTTQELINKFDKITVIPYVDMPSPSSHTAQLTLLTKVDSKQKLYTTEIFSLDGVTLPKAQTDTKMKMFHSGSELKNESDTGMEQRLRIIEAKQEKVEKKVFNICEHLHDISLKVNKVYTYLSKAQQSMNESRRKETKKDQANPKSTEWNLTSSDRPSLSSTDLISPIHSKANSNTLEAKGFRLAMSTKLPTTSKTLNESNKVAVVKATKPQILPKPKILHNMKVGNDCKREAEGLTIVRRSQKNKEPTKIEEEVKRNESRSMKEDKEKNSSNASYSIRTLPVSFKKSLQKSKSFDFSRYMPPQSSSSTYLPSLSSSSKKDETKKANKEKSGTTQNPNARRNGNEVNSVAEEVDISDWCTQIEDELNKLYSNSIVSLPLTF